MPRRCKFADGSAGWEALFPNEDITSGLNPKNPYCKTLKGMEREIVMRYNVRIIFRGGDFPPRTKDGRWGKADFENKPYVDVSLVPLENPAGAAIGRALICQADALTDDVERQFELRQQMQKRG